MSGLPCPFQQKATWWDEASSLGPVRRVSHMDWATQLRLMRSLYDELPELMDSWGRDGLPRVQQVVDKWRDIGRGVGYVQCWYLWLSLRETNAIRALAKGLYEKQPVKEWE